MAQNARFTAPAEFSLAVIGGLAGFIWVKDPHWLLAGLFPGAISQLTLRYIAARNRKAVHFSALDQLGRQLSLGLSVEEVFHSTSEHLRRVRSVDGCFLIVDDLSLRLTDGLAADPACAAKRAVRPTVCTCFADRGSEHARVEVSAHALDDLVVEALVGLRLAG